MNGLTIVVLFVLFGFAAVGYSKGLLRTVYSVISGILILVVVTAATPYVAQALAEYTTLDTQIESACRKQLRDIVLNSDEGKKAVEKEQAAKEEAAKKQAAKEKAAKKSEKKSEAKTSKKSSKKSNKKSNKKSGSKSDKKSNKKSSGKAADKKVEVEEVLDAEVLKDVGKLEIHLPDSVLKRLVDVDQYADDLLNETGIYDEVSQRITKMILQAIAFVLTFVVLVVLSAILFQAFHIIEKLPVIETANKGLGAVLGLAKGLVIVWIAFALVALNAMSEFGQELIIRIYQSPILTAIYENNLVLSLLMHIR